MKGCGSSGAADGSFALLLTRQEERFSVVTRPAQCRSGEELVLDYMMVITRQLE
ncbi:MAG: hypothetical protein R3E79_33655 [Caldilineaceae bacterium]